MINSILLSDILNTRGIVQIYTGAERGCRCGCKGKYFNKGSMGFSRARNKTLKLNPVVKIASSQEEAQELISEQHENDYNGKIQAIGTFYAQPDSDGATGWLDISLGNGKTITLYVK